MHLRMPSSSPFLAQRIRRVRPLLSRALPDRVPVLVGDGLDAGGAGTIFRADGLGVAGVTLLLLRVDFDGEGGSATLSTISFEGRSSVFCRLVVGTVCSLGAGSLEAALADDGLDKDAGSFLGFLNGSPVAFNCAVL